MEKVYIIYKNYSDYDYPATVIGFKESEEEAKKYVNDLSNEYKIVSEKFDELWERRRRISEKFADPINKPVLKEWPRWASNIKITDEMRKERADIQAHNDELRSEYNKIVNENRRNIIEELKKTITPEESELVNKCITFEEYHFSFNYEDFIESQPYYYETCNKI